MRFGMMVTAIALLAVVSQGAERYDDKAFRVVTKLCGACHGTPFFFAKQLEDEEWEEIFHTQGRLQAIHANTPKATASLSHGWLRKYRKRILKFFIAHSKFSGSVHGCDGNFCGAKRKSTRQK